MRKILILVILAFCMLESDQSAAQQMPQRYATIELFTNTPCGSCQNQNPGFFNLISGYDGYHLISFYPGRPYSNCPIYQANKSENETRSSHRGVFGTPTVNFNGEFSKSSGQINANDMMSIQGQESFLHIGVSESTGMSRTATIDLSTFDTSPSSEGLLFVAVVEREYFIENAPSNWEEEHFNVFRKFLSGAEGDLVDLTLASQSLSFNYTVDPNWDPELTYVLAWVENPDDGVSYNSGTRFDDPFSSINETVNVNFGLFVQPNPVQSELNISYSSDANLAQLSIYNSIGQMVQRLDQGLNTFEMSDLASGTYQLVAITNEGLQQAVQFVKQ